MQNTTKLLAAAMALPLALGLAVPATAARTMETAMDGLKPATGSSIVRI